MKSDLSRVVVVMVGYSTVLFSFDVHPPTKKHKNPLKNHWPDVFMVIVLTSAVIPMVSIGMNAACIWIFVLISVFAFKPTMQFYDKDAQLTFIQWVKIALPSSPVFIIYLLLMYNMPEAFPSSYTWEYGVGLFATIVYLVYRASNIGMFGNWVIPIAAYIVLIFVVKALFAEGSTINEILYWEAFWMSVAAAVHCVFIMGAEAKRVLEEARKVDRAEDLGVGWF